MKTNHLLSLAAAVAAAGALTAGGASAAGFVNGSFEDGLTGWTAQHWFSDLGGSDGSFSAATSCSDDPCMDPFDPLHRQARLAQTLTGLTGGASYTVTFEGNSHAIFPNALAVYADGVKKVSLINFNNGFATYGFDFVAGGTTADVEVFGRNDFFTVQVDNFRLTGGPRGAAPEPAAWALMLGGFGLAGAAMRRKRAARPAPH
jgi:hypothetical protein